MSQARKLDIFAALQAIDRRDFHWLHAQSEEARKEFKPVVVMRWAAGVQGDGPAALYTLWLVNQRVNRYIFDLYQYPDLCFRLLASCGEGHSLRREWIKGLGRNTSDNVALTLLATQQPLANDAELRMLLAQYSRQQFAELLADCGITDKEADKHMKAYDKLR